jgi:hypothetical protein
METGVNPRGRTVLLAVLGVLGIVSAGILAYVSAALDLGDATEMVLEAITLVALVVGAGSLILLAVDAARAWRDTPSQ